eukprot:CAMPEP_0206529944 /NCGR_PEP_ID=MMETSP0325_2-20121206/2883_1 /ASSEMBLY_ACC=CAM_ASM_000347 /TAXON_ID=2866 /ORGANISM="Crypthecodinium cohnii, Strain Seligo" /LENGTH=113 /DNA_ID=CAMNT_0054025917 /DNA_START=673 /DNA_END=1013 /DNA_ORIENTATION=+
MSVLNPAFGVSQSARQAALEHVQAKDNLTAAAAALATILIDDVSPPTSDSGAELAAPTPAVLANKGLAEPTTSPHNLSTGVSRSSRSAPNSEKRNKAKLEDRKPHFWGFKLHV